MFSFWQKPKRDATHVTPIVEPKTERKVDADSPIIIPILSIHPDFDYKKLNDNGKVYSDDVINAIKNLLNKQKEGGYPMRYLLKELGKEYKGIDYAVIRVTVKEQKKSQVKYFAVCMEVAQGKTGVFKIIQDLDTGKFHGLKSNLVIKESKESGPNSFAKDTTKAEYAIYKAISKALNNNNPLIQAAMTPKHYKDKERKTKKPEKVQMIMDLVNGVEAFSFVSNEEKAKPYHSIHKKMHPARLLDLAIIGVTDLISLHDAGFLHGDIRDTNWMIDIAKNLAKLIDFGFSKKMGKSKEIRSDMFLGTAEFLAPELIEEFLDRDTLVYNQKTDIYALGITLQLVLGFPYLEVERNKEHKINWEWGKFRYLNEPKQYHTQLSEQKELAAILDKMTSRVAKNRLDAKTTLKELNTFKQKFLNITPPLEIGTVNIVEFNSYSESEKKALLEQLKDCHEIVFVGNIESWRQKNGIYLPLQDHAKYFSENGFIVREGCIQNPTSKVLQRYFQDLVDKDSIPIHATHFNYTDSKVNKVEIFGTKKAEEKEEPAVLASTPKL